MKLQVDLLYEKFYKQVLCKLPQIRDREFDDKQNIVSIKVVCCDPEKMADKLCCKGCGVIKSIEIVEPPTEPVVTDPKPSTPPTPVPHGVCCRPGGPCFERCGKPPLYFLPPVYIIPRPVVAPNGVCCDQCGRGRPCGPCSKENGPLPPSPCYGGSHSCGNSVCEYFCEDNSSGCTVV